MRTLLFASALAVIVASAPVAHACSYLPSPWAQPVQSATPAGPFVFLVSCNSLEPLPCASDAALTLTMFDSESGGPIPGTSSVTRRLAPLRAIVRFVPHSPLTGTSYRLVIGQHEAGIFSVANRGPLSEPHSEVRVAELAHGPDVTCDVDQHGGIIDSCGLPPSLTFQSEMSTGSRLYARAEGGEGYLVYLGERTSPDDVLAAMGLQGLGIVDLTPGVESCAHYFVYDAATDTLAERTRLCATIGAEDQPITIGRPPGPGLSACSTLPRFVEDGAPDERFLPAWCAERRRICAGQPQGDRCDTLTQACISVPEAEPEPEVDDSAARDDASSPPIAAADAGALPEERAPQTDAGCSALPHVNVGASSLASALALFAMALLRRRALRPRQRLAR